MKDNLDWWGDPLESFSDTIKPISINKQIEKRCSNCFLVKPLESFYKKETYRQSHCIQCHPEIVAAWKAKSKGKPKRQYFRKTK